MGTRHMLLVSALFLVFETASAAEIWATTIKSGRDPFTPPQTRMECVNWAYPFPNTKICIGHAYQCKYMDSTIRLIVSGPDGEDAKKQVIDCVGSSAVQGLISGIVTGYLSGGAGAVEAAVATFTATLKMCVSENIKGSIDAKVDTTSAWTDWGSC